MVISATPGRGLTVVLSTGQVPAYPVKVITHGPSDGTTVSHKPYPKNGTWGLCAFPGGDNRSGVWLGSLYLSGQDAMTSDTDPNIDLDSHFSGNYTLTDGAGNYTQSFCDGTYIQSATTTAKPVLNRHVINPDQSRSLVPFPDSARIPNPPSVRPFIIHHASGASIQIDPTGDITLTAAGSNTAALTMDAAGTVTLDAATLLSLGGFGTAVQKLVDARFVALFNAHVHLNGTGIPTTQMSVGNHTTTVTQAS